MSGLTAQVRQEPMMIIGAALNVTVVLITAFAPGLHLTQDDVAAISTISTAVTSAASAFLTTPLNLGIINSAISTALVASAAFGLHLPPSDTALAAGAVTTALSYFMREKVSPTVLAR